MRYLTSVYVFARTQLNKVILEFNTAFWEQSQHWSTDVPEGASSTTPMTKSSTNQATKSSFGYYNYATLPRGKFFHFINMYVLFVGWSSSPATPAAPAHRHGLLRVLPFFDGRHATCVDHRRPVLVAIVYGEFAKLLERLPLTQATEECMVTLRAMFGQDVPQPVFVKITAWYSNP